ncbi:MAG: ABC transporter substrate-binding protein [Acidimicrobiaceae bacterium]|nr:ABC transporter substrate-binding protein [Acidimicrobiaceae bacterium]MBO0748159.1 ABC transporter substrate-binding protein [Acidimicrobiaceae bacterium]
MRTYEPEATTAERRRRRKPGLRRRVAASLAIFGLAILGTVPMTAPAATAASSPVNICMIGALSGPFTELGLYDGQGAVAWAKYLNKHGGLLGHQVKLTKEDDHSDPATAASLVRKCVTQDHANFIFGPEETATAAAGIPVINQLKTVAIVWESGWAGQGVTGSQLTGYAFPSITNVFHADDQAFVQKLVAPRHLKRVAVIQDNAPGGLGNDKYTASLGKKYGFKMVASQTVTPGSTDDTPAVLKLMRAHPQAIVLGMIPGTDTITALKAIRAQSPNIPIGECSGCALPAFVKAAGGYATMKNVYIIGTPQQLADSLPRTKANMPVINDTKQYLSAMKAAGLSTENDLDQSSAGWDTGIELQTAVKAANSLDTSKVRTAMTHEKVAVGGLFGQFYQRTPQNYENIVRLVSVMSVLKPNGKVAVFSAG